MKKLDDLGRITLPVSLRKKYNLVGNVTFEENERGILIKRAEDTYFINDEEMYCLRKIYNMLKINDLLDENEDLILKNITKATGKVCPNCEKMLFKFASGVVRCLDCE